MKTDGKMKKKSPGRQIWRRFLRNKSSVISLILLCALFLVSFISPFFIDESLVYDQNAAERNLAPSADHWFGTDNYGRDLFARVWYGARISLAIGLLTVIIGFIIGGLLGAIAAYYGGIIDSIIMRISDVTLAIPEIMLCMCVVAAAGASVASLVLAMVISTIPGRCRLVRSAVLGVVDKEFIEAARVAGMGDLQIIVTQILPNAVGPIIVVATQGIASVMLTAAGLSYLGVGVQPPNPEWGALIASAREFFMIYPYMCIIPGVVISLTSLGFNLLGDGLRDALDPRLKD